MKEKKTTVVLGDKDSALRYAQSIIDEAVLDMSNAISSLRLVIDSMETDAIRTWFRHDTGVLRTIERALIVARDEAEEGSDALLQLDRVREDMAKKMRGERE